MNDDNGTIRQHDPGASYQPLAGVRVLDLTRLLPGNLCTLALAQLGAEVIKVEDTGAGDYMRGFGRQVDGAGVCHHSVNRGKLSVTLDLKDVADRERFEALVATADVLVESFRPGVMGRLGYDVETLHGIRPSLVIASISGYGSNGPLSQEAGHDLNYLAFSGLLDRLRPQLGPSVGPPLPLADLVGGGLVPALLITAFVGQARQSRRGVWIDAAMAEGIALLPHVLINDLLNGQPSTGPRSSLLDGGLACYGTYALTDGQVAIASLEIKFWLTVCDLVGGLDDYRGKHEDPASQPAIRRRLTEYFLGRSRADIEAVFGGRDACVTVVRSYEEMLESDQAKARDFLVDHPDLPVPVLAFPAMVDGRRLAERGPAPAHGEHNSHVFGALGLEREPVPARPREAS
ncbi:CaiB/BaiF CoA-transferase family protein [Pseudonocardia ailaonensis]|uniref:CaiB/BaiF CoA-transferase family protein n=1 Tax=Pseudonocardia ailaonensis TaxID=367279 RepID=A0ABN2NHN0_9PSEU